MATLSRSIGPAARPRQKGEVVSSTIPTIVNTEHVPVVGQAPIATHAHSDSQFSIEYSKLLKSSKIAIIDDEEVNIDVVQGYLQQEGYKQFFATTKSIEAIEMITEVDPDVVLLDIMMPHVSGLQILTAMRSVEKLCHIPVIVLTASNDANIKLESLRLGPSDFLSKPVDASELLLRIRNVLIVKTYQDQLEDYSHRLEERVKARTEQLHEKTKQLAKSRQRIIHCLARAAEFRDNETGQHVIRVGKYVAVIARRLGFDDERVEILEQAAQLHDIGKIGVPDSVLLKEGKLEPEEFDIIKRHCSFGNSIIAPMSQGEAEAYRRHSEIGASLLDIDGYPVLEVASIIAQTHHEKWDGSGYPLGLAGEDIPIEGRITAVADVFDALSSKRPYKEAMSRDKCFEILEEGRNKHFDASVLDAFFAGTKEIVNIQIRHADGDQ